MPTATFSAVRCQCVVYMDRSNHPYVRIRPHYGPNTVKPVFIVCPLFREFREPGKFTKITGRENLNTVAFQCSRKQKRQNYGVQTK